MTERRQFEAVKYVFDPEELRQLGEQLAREAQTVFDIEKEKATSAAAFGARLKAGNKRVADLADRINLGYELREVEVLVLLETPRPGMKRIIRADTAEVIREEAMTTREMQGSFGFPDPEASS